MGENEKNYTRIADPMGYEPEVQVAAGLIGKGICKVFEFTSNVSDPTGSVANAASQFAKAAAPVVIGASKIMMENTYAQNELPGSKYLREHPLRSNDGTPLTVEEAKQMAFEEIDSYGVVKSSSQIENNIGHSGGIKR